MRVFVLTTGRSGSTTFVEACSHITNFTASHESRAALIGDTRFDYPDDHIEVDNRLSWFTGSLAQRFPDARYVHLVRDESAVTRSFVKRWPSQPPIGRRLWEAVRPPEQEPNLISAFANGLIMHFGRWPGHERPAVTAFMIETINANLSEFLAARPHLVVRLENIQEDFRRFWDWIGAQGDLSAALAEWGNYYNAS